MSQLPTRHCSVSALFSLWDSEHSGWVELDELALVLSKWSGSISELVKERGIYVVYWTLCYAH